MRGIIYRKFGENSKVNLACEKHERELWWRELVAPTSSYKSEYPKIPLDFINC